MEDLDQIVIVTLANLAPHLKVSSLEDLLKPEILVPFTASCIAAINQSTPIVTALPQSMSQRYGICTALSKLLKDQGYSGSLGFNVFLYPSIKEVRNLANFLLENMPKDTSEQEAATTENIFLRKVKLRIKDWTEEQWMPPFDYKKAFKLQATGHYLEHIEPRDLPPELKALEQQYLQSRKHGNARFLQVRSMAFLPNVHIQAQLKSAHSLITDEILSLTKPTYIEAPPPVKASLPSLATVLQRSLGVKGMMESSVFSHETQFKQDVEVIVKEEEPTPEVVVEAKEETPVVKVQSRQGEVDDLERQLERVTVEAQEAESLMVQRQLELHKTELTLEEIKAENERLKREAEAKHRAAVVLQDDGNLTRLRDEVKEQQLKLDQAKNQWLEYKQPLVEEVKSNEKTLDKMRKNYTDKLDQIKQMKTEMKEMVEEAQFKEELLELLQAEEAKGSTPVARTVYIRRITEVSDRMKTQKRELVQNMRDVTELQQSISVSRDTIARVDAATEDLVFQDAKKNSSSKPLYKLLVDLREQYAALVQAVEAQNRIKSSMRDIELRIETLRARNANHNIKQLREDIEKFRQERAS
mmetsp:Transcript_1137/g.2747  ORF Transcript_1137/g.2747 Transcript_1137/m.2747 type:complete len:584 (-) Transcript_1137:35-1786(-)